MIASASGIRGVLNRDIALADLGRFAEKFAATTNSPKILLGRDTRNTGQIIRKAVVGSLLSKGVAVSDLGVVSTPAIFRESLLRKIPAIMITASHNEPEFNGLKFVVDGLGTDAAGFANVVADQKRVALPFATGVLKRQARTSYNDDLVASFGEGSCEGVKVAIDLGGGAAIGHAAPILKRLGCEVFSVNDSPGVFSRRIDPLADKLSLLQKVVKAHRCSIGLGFDCDGDRLAIVDNTGKTRTGDFMLTLAFVCAIPQTGERRLVVSLDTTQAVDDVARKMGIDVFRSRVGEANVVGLMREKGCRFGGEGSSGGFIDGSFNYCRDSMLAAITIVKALRERGVKLYDDVRGYNQARLGLRLPRAKSLRAIKTLAARYKDSDTTDGLKLRLSRKSWVLIRPSGTEDLVRVSAESDTSSGASKIAETFARRMKELTK